MKKELNHLKLDKEYYYKIIVYKDKLYLKTNLIISWNNNLKIKT
jgi:hypothetical protein